MPKRIKKPVSRKTVLCLTDLDHAKFSVVLQHSPSQVGPTLRNIFQLTS
jgi:hypothetical protein